jgi:Prefoldin subunit
MIARIQEHVEDFLAGTSVEAAMGALNELYSKYKFMETSFEKTKSNLKSKLPEFEQTLQLLKTLKAKQDEGEEVYTSYSLCDTIYAKAKVNQCQ